MIKIWAVKHWGFHSLWFDYCNFCISSVISNYLFFVYCIKLFLNFIWLLFLFNLCLDLLCRNITLFRFYFKNIFRETYQISGKFYLFLYCRFCIFFFCLSRFMFFYKFFFSYLVVVFYVFFLLIVVFCFF